MGFASIIVAAIALGAPSDAAVRADWAAHGQDPALRYLTLDPVSVQRREKWEKITAFVVPSSSRGDNIDRELPVRVGKSNAYRIDLSYLKWDAHDLNKVLERYPYARNDAANPLLTIRADWLVAELADARVSKAYGLLLYGEKSVPKTDTEFRKFWGVADDQQAGQRFGLVEGASLVNLQGTRFLERWNARGRSLWGTKDSSRTGRGTDPIEALDGNFKHDGRELIASITAVSPSRGVTGLKLVYMLANGDGKTVDVAPAGLVEDHKRTIGSAEIVNNSSCIGCHETGFNYPQMNLLRESLKVGELLQVYDKQKQADIEAFHLGDIGTSLQRDNQDYAAFVTCTNGLSPIENAKLYRQGLADYRADLTLQRAAGELYCEPEALKNALGYASANSIVMPSRIAGLAHGLKVPRGVWEDYFLEVKAMLEVWQAGQK